MTAWPLLLFILAFILFVPVDVSAQRERRIDPPDSSEGRFFEQLRSLFGRFRDADLQRAFDIAQPIRCSTLVSDDGEWRPVAFFNEDRKLGESYHQSIEDVKSDPSVYIFRGECEKDRSNVQLTTKFPVEDSLYDFIDGKIRFEDILVNVNAPVTASYDSFTQAYSFELPYMYAVRGRRGPELVYSLVPMRSTDRYAESVKNRWECKSVHANDVTFQFLICLTQTLPRELPAGTRARQTFGANAYFILSDGREASTSFKLSFGGPGSSDTPTAPADSPRPPEAVVEPLGRSTWQIPVASTRLTGVAESEFRIRFNPQTWAGRIGTAQVLLDQKLSGSDVAKVVPGSDYCAWRPALTDQSRLLSNNPDGDVAYSIVTTERSGTSPVSISFEMKTYNGFQLGTLQCFFPQSETAESILVDQWVGIVGGHMTLEVNP